eukprot:g50713.t1
MDGKFKVLLLCLKAEYGVLFLASGIDSVARTLWAQARIQSPAVLGGWATYWICGPGAAPCCGCMKQCSRRTNPECSSRPVLVDRVEW